MSRDQIAPRQFLSLNYLAITLTAGVILKEKKCLLLWAKDSLGGIVGDNLGKPTLRTLPKTEISKARDSEVRDSEVRDSESRDSEAGGSENGKAFGGGRGQSVRGRAKWLSSSSEIFYAEGTLHHRQTKQSTCGPCILHPSMRVILVCGGPPPPKRAQKSEGKILQMSLLSEAEQ